MTFQVKPSQDVIFSSLRHISPMFDQFLCVFKPYPKQPKHKKFQQYDNFCLLENMQWRTHFTVIAVAAIATERRRNWGQCKNGAKGGEMEPFKHESWKNPDFKPIYIFQAEVQLQALIIDQKISSVLHRWTYKIVHWSPKSYVLGWIHFDYASEHLNNNRSTNWTMIWSDLCICLKKNLL